MDDLLSSLITTERAQRPTRCREQRPQFLRTLAILYAITKQVICKQPGQDTPTRRITGVLLDRFRGD